MRVQVERPNPHHLAFIQTFGDEFEPALDARHRDYLNNLLSAYDRVVCATSQIPVLPFSQWNLLQLSFAASAAKPHQAQKLKLLTENGDAQSAPKRRVLRSHQSGGQSDVTKS